jgi:carboxyl-terminal processing protease
MKKSLKKFFKIVLIIVVVGAIYTAGYAVGHRNVTFEKGYIPKVINTNLDKPSDVDFSLFWDAWNVAKNRFVGSLDQQKMVYGAISGMLQSLGDPYTVFMNPDEAKQFNEDLKGEFDGIGAEIEAKDGYLVIVSPLSDSPAEKAGLKAKDVILKIDGTDVTGMGFYEAINKIKGPKNSIVALTIARDGAEEPSEIQVKRDTIVVKSVEYKMKDDVAYIKISQFGDDTLDLVKKGVDMAISKNAKGVIVDLRNNPGGYLKDAIDIISLFVEKGKVVVIEKGKDGIEHPSSTTLSPKITDKPIVILVNGGSASASEIFAGAMQDYNRGKLIGEKTFGKGSVQTMEKLDGGAQVKVTIAEWLTPNKRQINKKGIEPDIKIELTDDDKKNGNDPQLDKALEEVRK